MRGWVQPKSSPTALPVWLPPAALGIKSGAASSSPHPGLRLFSQAQRNRALEAEQSFVFVYIDRPMCLRTRAGHVESSPDRVLYSVDSVNFHQAIPSVALTPNPDFKKSFRQSSAAGSVTPAPYILHTMFVTKTSKFQPPFPWQCAPVVLC